MGKNNIWITMASIVSWGLKPRRGKAIFTRGRRLSMFSIKYFLFWRFPMNFQWAYKWSNWTFDYAMQSKLFVWKKKRNSYYVPLWTITRSKSAANHQFTCFHWVKFFHFLSLLLIIKTFFWKCDNLCPCEAFRELRLSCCIRNIKY